jgi:hypothetical protein
VWIGKIIIYFFLVAAPLVVGGVAAPLAATTSVIAAGVALLIATLWAAANTHPAATGPVAAWIAAAIPPCKENDTNVQILSAR